MIKVKTSTYFKQVVTALLVSILLGVGFYFIFHTGWAFIIIPVFMCFYARDINRCFYLIGDMTKKKFLTGTFTFAGDIELVKRQAERAKNVTEGRLGAARMSINTYEFKEYGTEDEPVSMVLYIPDSINYRFVLSRIIANKDHRFKITYGAKSGVITEFKS